MSFKQKAIALIIKEAIKYVRKDYDKNLFKLIDFGDKLEKIEMNAFQDCAIDGELVFPRTLKYIGEVLSNGGSL